MSKLTASRGDTWRVSLTDLVDEDDAAVALSNVVLRAQVRRSINGEIVLRGTSYPGGGIIVTEAATPNARAEWRVSPADTMLLIPREHVYDWEINRRGAVVSTTGTATTAAGSSQIELSVALPAGTRAEDVLLSLDGGADAGLLLVTAINAGLDVVTVEGWSATATAGTIAFSLRRNERWSPVTGIVDVTADVTRTGAA